MAANPLRPLRAGSCPAIERQVMGRENLLRPTCRVAGCPDQGAADLHVGGQRHALDRSKWIGERVVARNDWTSRAFGRMLVEGTVHSHE